MPSVITVDPSFRLGLITTSGTITGHDLAAACVSMVTADRWESGFDEVWDLTGSPEIGVTPDEIDEMVTAAHDYARQIGANRCVFVTARESVTDVLRLFERLTRDLPRTYSVARTLGEASDHLGLPDGTLERIETGGRPLTRDA